MNDVAEAKLTRASTPTAQIIPRFLRAADFPATGAVIAQVVRARRGPDDLLAALRRLTPGKVFHNVYEVWFDTFDGHVDRRKAAASAEAWRLRTIFPRDVPPGRV
jgi:hypothetical protein